METGRKYSNDVYDVTPYGSEISLSFTQISDMFRNLESQKACLRPITAIGKLAQQSNEQREHRWV